MNRKTTFSENPTQNKDTLKVKVLFLLLAFVMFAFFGLSFVIGKKTLQVSAPYFLTATRMFLAAIILFVVQWIYRKDQIRGIKGCVKEIILLSIFNIYLTNGLEFWGLQYLSSYKTCYVYSLSPFLAAIISYIFLKEKLGRNKIIGLLVALVGFLPLLIYKEAEDNFYVSLPEWALLGAVVATVIGWVSMRELVTVKKYPLLLANSYSMFLGGLLAWGTSIVFEGVYPFPVSNFSLFISGMLAITLINNLIGYNLYAFLTKKFTVTLMSFIGFVTPLITALFGWFFLKEEVTLLFFISYGVVLIGFLIFSREELVKNVK